MLVVKKSGLLFLYIFRVIHGIFVGMKRSKVDKGFVIVHNYFSELECEILKREIDSLPDTAMIAYDNDRRAFGSQHLSEEINKRFAAIPALHDLGELIVNRKLRYQTTLAGSVSYRVGSQGSGGDWHVDSHTVQFKAMIYLTDVTDDNGPFEIIPGSHKPWWFLQFLLRNWFRLDSITRFNNKMVEGYKTYRILGKKGTLLLFNPLLIHRGAPLYGGERYALTNYYVDSRVSKNTAIDSFDKEQKESL